MCCLVKYHLISAIIILKPQIHLRLYFKIGVFFWDATDINMDVNVIMTLSYPL